MMLNTYMAMILAGVCCAIFGAFAYEYAEARSARKRFQQGGAVAAGRSSLIDTVLKPVFSFYAPLLTRFRFTRTRERLDRKFAHAAIEHYTHEDFWAFQILSALLFMLFGYILVLELNLMDLEYSIPWWGYPIAAGFGFFFPYLWINSLIKKRREEIILAFPQFVANLTLTVEAGLDFIAAMTRIVRKMDPSPLREELGRVLSEIQLGGTRAQALRNFSARVGATEISTFTLVLIQADRLGTSIGKALRVQAERLRRERFEAAERKGALASQKLLFPLIFFIMPAVFIIIFGPLIVKLVTEGFQGLMV